MVEARAQQTMACSPEEFLEFAMDVERYAEVDDKIGRFDWVRRDGNRVEFKFRPAMPGLPGPAPKMIAQGILTPGKRVDVGLAPLPDSKLWHRLMKFNASFVCEPGENGTLVTRTMAAEITPALRWLIDPILRRNLPGNIETEIRQAKAYIERHSSRN
ncbi:SRPBCC family protein [Nocardia higoensis]|uniref:SRPBCC family protein n=1 Tax=Nocardia higoensis TaxID=228599 RepID=A0ABS0D3D6_9NOCA|nr:SRPBCC family protein [Nocardia higoensis]MBF6353011.1 SRPBCC family protein [Nocardia higoensis]